MSAFSEVFKYTIKENVKKKSFIISTIVILVIIVAVMSVPALINHFQGSDSEAPGGGIPGIQEGQPAAEKQIISFVDESGLFKDSLSNIETSFPGYAFKLESRADIEKIKSDIRQEGDGFLLVASVKDDIPVLEYFVNQYGDGPSPDIMSKVFKNVYAYNLLKGENVSDQTISKTLSDLSFNTSELGKSKWGGYFASIFIVIILFFAIYFYGYGVSMSVASEKTSRVMEILVTSVRPSSIILGKTAGMGLLGLIQLAVILAVGALTYSLVYPPDFTIGGMSLDLSAFTPFTIAIMIIYFIFGYTLYALMYAVVGATVSKAEDVNSAMMPMSFVSIIAFYFSYGTFAIPDSTAARIASLIPFCSPFSIPSRLISTNVPPWEIIVSLVLLVATMGFIGALSIKLYSFAVLHYGDRLKISTLFKVSKENRF